MGMNESTIAATADAQRRAFTPVTADNHVFRWLPTGSEAIEAMLQHIERAEYYVALEFYICKPGAVSDRFRVALIAACLRGVHVQVLFDAFGFGRPFHDERVAAKPVRLFYCDSANSVRMEPASDSARRDQPCFARCLAGGLQSCSLIFQPLSTEAHLTNVTLQARLPCLARMTALSSGVRVG